MSFTHALSTNRYGEGDLIVSTNPANGTHVTLALAMAAATSGQTIFLRDSVTENVTLTAGVNIAAWDGGSLNTPTITGTLTMTAAGTCNISGIRLVTNGANLLAVTGSAASVVNLKECYLNCADATGISYTSSSASSQVNIFRCRGNIGTIGITLFSASSTGSLNIFYSEFGNSGLTTTASTISAGTLNVYYSTIGNPVTTSGTASLGIQSSVFNQPTNTTALTVGGGVNSSAFLSTFSSGSASAISIGNQFSIHQSIVSSTNTNAVTGAGTLFNGGMSFPNSGFGINTTTQTPNISRYGINLSTNQPAFLGYLPSTVLNVTGAGASFAIGTTTALTEVFDQNSNFNTNGTFTAPYTGKYFVQGNCFLTGCTINTGCQTNLTTSNRTYTGAVYRGASNLDSISGCCAVADFDAGDTMTVNVVGLGEAGNTDDIFGFGAPITYMSGFLIC